MKETHIVVQPTAAKDDETSLLCWLNTHDDDAPLGGQKSYPFVIDLSGDAFSRLRSRNEGDHIMDTIGDELFRALSGHPVISGHVFGCVLPGVQAENCHPIYFEVKGDDGSIEDVPFEALRHERCGFLALDRRWPISRIQDPSSAGPQISSRPFGYPLNFMAVLSSTDENDSGFMPDVVGQWDALERSLTRAYDVLRRRWEPRDGCQPLEARILTNVRSLFEDINKQAGRSWLRAELIESKDQFLRQLHDDFEPHLLHLFCHGPSHSEPQLRIGTLSDYDGAGAGSIALSARELTENPKLTKSRPPSWLITLNACSSAENGTVQSFAKTLVVKGAPCAIGMRDQIDTGCADRLCEAIYDGVFERIAHIGLDGEAEEVDWSFGMGKARQELLRIAHERDQLDEHDCMHWTIPVLYRSSTPLQLHFIGKRDEERQKLAEEYDALSLQEAQLVQLLRKHPQVATILEGIANEKAAILRKLAAG